MGRFHAFLIIFLALLALPALACHRITPHQMPVDEYETVFLGRVTGVHLLGYENALMDKPDAQIEGVGGINFIDGSAPVLVKAVALHVHHGKPQKTMEIRLVGCTAPLPELKERGLFFVHSESASAVTVWESDEEAFAYWLDRLGIDGDEREVDVAPRRGSFQAVSRL